MNIGAILELKMWTNGSEYVIAESISEVKSEIARMYGAECFESEDDWHTLPLDQSLSIGRDGPDNPEKKQVLDWIQEHGFGHIASTENY